MINEDFYKFEKIYVENKFASDKNVESILSRLPGKPPIILFDDIIELIRSMPAVYDPHERSKNLVLSGIRGEILRRCPGSHGRMCCNYYVVNLYIGCPIGCTYCILQSYLNQPFTIINVDIENIISEIKKITSANKDKIYRIGTGELGDSLVYDPITGFSGRFIDSFSEMENCIFEFKTKTDYIGNLLIHGKVKNIVAGFSVNPQIIAGNEEQYSTPVIERLRAAKKLTEKNYRIALHFDPIINIIDFENQYGTLIEDIFKHLEPGNLAWISLGTLRFSIDQKNMMEYNYPRSRIIYDEFVENYDRKFRYFMPLRMKIYRAIVSMIRNKSKDLLIYFCMESSDIWKRCLNILPYEEKKMDLLFKNAIIN